MTEVQNKTINTVTNVLGAIAFFIEPIRAYLTTTEFNWQTFIICVVTTAIAFFTGKK